jgi:hypothetical protein
MTQLKEILEIAPPLTLQTSIVEGTDTTVHDEIVLETPTLLINGWQVDTKTGKRSRRTNLSVTGSVSQNLNTKVFRSNDPLTFRGDIEINFSSRYPLKTYNSVMKNNDLFVGHPEYNYQYEKAEIRYMITGGSVKYKGRFKETYKEPIIIKENASGSDNTMVRFKIFYKGKWSEEGLVELRVIKTNNTFYGD